jgi:hypothetical protein
MFSKLSITPESIQPGDLIDTQDGLGIWFEVEQVSIANDLIVVFPPLNDTLYPSLLLEPDDEVFVLRKV